MATRFEAKELAKTLAAEGHSATKIRTELDEQGFEGLLGHIEIESLVIAAGAAKNLVPSRPSRLWPRVVGLIAVLLGLGGIALGGLGIGGRYSPAGLGATALILGLILLIKPGWASEQL